jgi:uncharacterized SAM-binding protein YcdF (DUF218 family)
MTLIVSRTLQSLLLPPAGLLLLMAAGFAIKGICRMFGRLLIATGFILLYLVSIGPVSDALIRPLEKAYPPFGAAPKGRSADAVVVLGGGVRDLAWIGLYPEPSETSLERVVAAIRLARSAHLPLVLVGGSGDPSKPGISEADAMARAASGLGVPRRDLMVIGTAQNTLESAAAVKERLKGKRIILVTSGFHMRRSVAMFRKKGLQVIPAPCGYRSEQRLLTFRSFIPRADCLFTSHVALAEYLSLAWYGLSGDVQ